MPRRLTFGGAAAEYATGHCAATRSLALGTLDCYLGVAAAADCGSPIVTTVTMLDERKAAILRAVVEEYIETAQPVGSATSPRPPGWTCRRRPCATTWPASSPTATSPAPHQRRADADREGLPLLRRPPRRPARLPGRRRQQVRDFFARAHGELEQMLPTPAACWPPHQPTPAWWSARSRTRRTVRSVQLVALGPTARCSSSCCPTAPSRSTRSSCPSRSARSGVAAATAHLTARLVGRPPGRRPWRCRRPVTPTPTTLVDRGRGRTGASVPRTIPNTSTWAARRGWPRRSTPSRRCARCSASSSSSIVVVSLLRDVLDRGLHVAIGTETGHGAAGRVLARGRPLRGRGRAGRHHRRARPDPHELPAGPGRRGRRQQPPRPTA